VRLFFSTVLNTEMKPFWPNISNELRSTISSLGKRRIFLGDEIIFLQGDKADFLPIVISGRVKMCHPFTSGKEVIIGIFGPGEMFAVPPVFDNEPYPASAFAIEQTELITIARDRVMKLFAESEEFAFAVVKWMCSMLRDKTAIIQSLAVSSPERRIASVLLRLADNAPANAPFQITLRRREIAEMAGLTTETTIRTTTRLAARGILKIDRGKIILETIEPLRALLSG
jgi:CRP/FNR family cyclic AMP-dependent transcriptional regulator